MSKKKKTAGGIVAAFGLVLFAFGFYIIPFGTDIYLYFWVEKVFHGNWFYGSLAGNLFALTLIIIGLLMMRDKGEEDEDDDIIIIRSNKGGKRK